jgi:hypothetical protein
MVYGEVTGLYFDCYRKPNSKLGGKIQNLSISEQVAHIITLRFQEVNLQDTASHIPVLLRLP